MLSILALKHAPGLEIFKFSTPSKSWSQLLRVSSFSQKSQRKKEFDKNKTQQKLLFVQWSKPYLVDTSSAEWPGKLS